jgi:hypothetical protein
MKIKKIIAILPLLFVSGCATSVSGMKQGTLGSDPVSVAEVFAIAFDEMAGCPLDIAKHLEVERPPNACTPTGIPKYEAHIQYPRH